MIGDAVRAIVVKPGEFLAKVIPKILAVLDKIPVYATFARMVCDKLDELLTYLGLSEKGYKELRIDQKCTAGDESQLPDLFATDPNIEGESDKRLERCVCLHTLNKQQYRATAQRLIEFHILKG